MIIHFIYLYHQVSVSLLFGLYVTIDLLSKLSEHIFYAFYFEINVHVSWCIIIQFPFNIQYSHTFPDLYEFCANYIDILS